MNNNLCIVSDFDGTITERDGLYTFIQMYAVGDWEKIEQEWAEGKINSKECLIEEFKLIPNLSEQLIDEFVKILKIDEYFIEFYNRIKHNNIDFYIVSDGIDYFIDRILYKYGLENIKIVSNHGEFVNGKFVITFPNDNTECKNNAGTCKCKILENLRNKYSKICYIGDGVSDYCVADKADVLFAKSRLAKYAKEHNIEYIPYKNFSSITNHYSSCGSIA